MARLIDADKRIAEIKNQYCTGCDNYGGVRCRACWVDDAICLIDDAPTVDAVEGSEFIERKAFREAFDNADADIVEEYGDGDCDWGFGRKNVLEVINSVPAADVAPVRHGRWIEYTKVIIPEPYNKWGQAWKCSE